MTNALATMRVDYDQVRFSKMTLLTKLFSFHVHRRKVIFTAHIKLFSECVSLLLLSLFLLFFRVFFFFFFCCVFSGSINLVEIRLMTLISVGISFVKQSINLDPFSLWRWWPWNPWILPTTSFSTSDVRATPPPPLWQPLLLCLSRSCLSVLAAGYFGLLLVYYN